MLRVAAALAEPTAAAKKARIPAEKRMVSNLSKESVKQLERWMGCWTKTSNFRGFYTFSLSVNHPV
jgi:hypothetical protein